MEDSKKKRVNITILPKIHTQLKELAHKKNTDVSKLIMDLVDKATASRSRTEHNWIWALKGDTLERIEQYAYEHHTTPDQAVTDLAFQEKGSRKTGCRRSARRNGGKDPDKKDSKAPQVFEGKDVPAPVTTPAEKDKSTSEVSHTVGEVIGTFLQESEEERMPESEGCDVKKNRRDDRQKGTDSFFVSSEESEMPSSFLGLSQYDEFLRGGS